MATKNTMTTIATENKNKVETKSEGENEVKNEGKNELESEVESDDDSTPQETKIHNDEESLDIFYKLVPRWNVKGSTLVGYQEHLVGYCMEINPFGYPKGNYFIFPDMIKIMERRLQYSNVHPISPEGLDVIISEVKERLGGHI